MAGRGKRYCLLFDAPGESDAARLSVAIVSVRNNSLFLWCCVASSLTFAPYLTYEELNYQSYY